MGKLIGQLFKEDIKSTILWFILPPIAVVSFLTLLVKFGESNIIGMLAALSTMLVFVAPFIALVQIAVNDWNRFYGKNAAFYSQIPVCAGRTTIARLINYTLMGIIAAVVALVNFLITGMVAVEEAVTFSEIAELFHYLTDYFGGKILFLIIIYIFVAGVMTVSEIMLANTLGSTKTLSGLGSFAPILMFIAVNLVVTFIFGRIQLGVSGDYVLSNVTESGIDINLASNPPYQVMIIPIIAGIVLIAVMAGISYYIHDKKLSVK